MKKLIYASAIALVISTGAFATEKKDVPADKKGSVEVHGFVRNYYAFDTRETVAGTEDFFLYTPKDQNIVDGEDLNAVASMRFAALTSRLWVEAKGYQFAGLNVAARIEADFYAGLSKTGTYSTASMTGAATFRLRQAYVDFGKNIWSIRAGQAWHPCAADLADVMSLNSGMPFGPFSRTPQVTLNLKFTNMWSLTASALWQMQYCSVGPESKSANYIKYGIIPEVYAGVNLTTEHAIVRLGLDVLSIKPRVLNSLNTFKVSDRITTLSPFFYAQYKNGMFSAKLKSIFAEAGEHMSLNGGYGLKAGEDLTTSCSYSPTRTLSSWVSFAYGKKWQATLFGGYVQNFGTKEAVDASNFWYSGTGFKNMNNMWRVTPGICYNIGKLALGIECEATAARYGDFGGEKKAYMLATENLRTVCNHRLLGLIKFTF